MTKQIVEIRGMDSRELRAKLNDLRKEQFDLRFRGAAEEVSKTARHKQIRHTIARIMTALGERERDQAAAAAGSKKQ
jgi:large subunit ribosomal protein L29